MPRLQPRTLFARFFGGICNAKDKFPVYDTTFIDRLAILFIDIL